MMEGLVGTRSELVKIAGGDIARRIMETLGGRKIPAARKKEQRDAEILRLLKAKATYSQVEQVLGVSRATIARVGKRAE